MFEISLKGSYFFSRLSFTQLSTQCRGNFDISLKKFRKKNSLNIDFTRFGGPTRTRTWDQYIMSVLL